MAEGGGEVGANPALVALEGYGLDGVLNRVVEPALQVVPQRPLVGVERPPAIPLALALALASVLVLPETVRRPGPFSVCTP